MLSTIYIFCVYSVFYFFVICLNFKQPVQQPDETLLMGMGMSEPRPPRPNSIELRRSYPDQVDAVYSGNSGVFSPRHTQSPTESHYRYFYDTVRR